MKWLIISGQIKKEKCRKFYCFHNTSRWHFVNPTPPGNPQLHSKIYVLVSIRDAVLRLPGSAVPGSWDTETSSKTQVLEVFPSISLPPSHNPTVPDKPWPIQGPEQTYVWVFASWTLLWTTKYCLSWVWLSTWISPKSLIFLSHHLCAHLHVCYTVLLLMQKLTPKITFPDMPKYSSFKKNYSVEFGRLVGQQGSRKFPCARKAVRAIMRICPTESRWW